MQYCELTENREKTAKKQIFSSEKFHIYGKSRL